MEELFLGSALCEVIAGGEILLPHYISETLRRRSGDQALFIGVHETSPCLIAFDRCYAQQRHYEEQAQRLTEDPPRLRRIYGFVERASIAPDGIMILPPLMRERGRIGDTVLLVATGQRFEIWDLEAVLQCGPSDLILLATHHRMAHIANEVMHVTSLPASRPHHCADGAVQSGVFLQPMPAVRPRHDPVERGTITEPVEKGSGRISRGAP